LVADGTVLAEGRGTDGLVAAELDLAALRALRRAVPVRRDKRRDLVAPG
jgi:predicted amidohydrolase